MELGAFSVSLNVKDIRASKSFYEALGFKEFGGNINQNWLIMKNGQCVIGLFQGMFENNILTFNPGWDQSANTLQAYTDIREIQTQLKTKGISFIKEIEETAEGPANFILSDPDGNAILIDQHV